ncbi:hypothetical protein [Aneurinibacillus migulanus]|uniref:hypothetical protein n=1 Tax=Aneurinibacillus migulanus TaxID=47500 RepID=UPI001F1E5043|nr:hypothetical protein [Aneurinibacillus migulanus]
MNRTSASLAFFPHAVQREMSIHRSFFIAISKKKGAFVLMLNDVVIIGTFIISFLIFTGFTEFCDRT